MRDKIQAVLFLVGFCGALVAIKLWDGPLHTGAVALILACLAFFAAAVVRNPIFDAPPEKDELKPDLSKWSARRSEEVQEADDSKRAT